MNSGHGKMRKTTKSWRKNAQQTQPRESREKCPLKPPRSWVSSLIHWTQPKSGFLAMAMIQLHKLWGKELSKIHLRDSAQAPWEWWKMKGCGWVNSLGMLFQEFTFPTSQIHPFPKWVSPQIRIWLPYPSHPHALISQPLPKWLGTKDKKGSL